MSARHFRTVAGFRAWLARHHAAATELWVVFYKKGSGRGGMVYADAVAQALCFGWIDGLTQTVDDVRYRQRFTPRRPRSHWSATNVARFQVLAAAGLVAPAGRQAFEAWDGHKAPYAGEHRAMSLAAPLVARFAADARAWQWFSRSPAGYQRTAVFWVMSAARESTRLRRLETLIADSAAGRRIAPLRPREGPRTRPSRLPARERAEPARTSDSTLKDDVSRASARRGKRRFSL